jgi:hypothetical protein
MSLLAAYRAVMLPELREAARERKRKREELRAWQEVEREKQKAKFQPVPDARMDNLHAHIESLGLPADVVSQFKSLTTGAKFALVEACGEHLKEALPLYLAIEPGARAMALRWARAGDFIKRLRACVPLGD